VVFLTLIDDERILVIMYENDGYYLGLLKVDFYELKCSILHDIPLNFYCLQIVVDSLGSSHFVLREFGSTTIRKGRVTDDKIHIDAQEIGIGADLDGLNLMGNQLFALRRSHEDETHWHYTQYELSLDSARKVTESPLIECLADLYRGSKYVWSDNKMYVVCRFDWNFSVAVFDAELRTWAKNKFVGKGLVLALSIDEDKILTVSAIGNPGTTKTVYRLPMRKPDKLRYLAWNTIRRGSFFFDSKIYGKLAPNLPYNSEFRSYFEPQ